MNGFWSFAYLDDVDDPDRLDPASVDCDESAAVPGAFDADPAHTGRRGTGVYKTLIDVQPDTPAQLRFDGLGLWSKVYLDGQPIATYDLPYGGWQVVLPPSQQRRRELAVVVDNRLHADRTPLVEPYFDFYLYGGIYRGVVLRELSRCSIIRAAVTVLDWRRGRIRVDVEASAAPDADTGLSVSFDHGAFETIDHAPWNGVHASIELSVPDPRPWSPGDPQLHTLTLQLGDDTFQTRFGLREVRVDGPRLLLNDQPLKLKGVCRHESHPQFGPALPDALILQDVQRLKQLGCNFVRGSHYPQDPRFLDLCDEYGLMVFEESLGWGAQLKHFESAHFVDRLEAQTRRMIRDSYNHPCVIMWGFLNEAHTEESSSRQVYERLTAAIRDEDSTRPVTFATNHPFEDVNLDLADVISVNCYPGWYSGPEEGPRPLHTIVPRLERIMDHLAKTGVGDRPYIISEIGAGAIYGWRDPHKAHWSEEYQADLLATVCEKFLSDERITGLAIWQFCDGRTYSDSQALHRPRAFNNKGLYDEYRRPKLAVETVRSFFK